MPRDAPDLMRGAALHASERLHSVAWQMDVDSFYGPLGETLMWITALADLVDKTEDPEYSGLAYARNCVLHGFVVVSEVHVQPPWSRSPLLGDVPRFTGLATARIWGFSEDPEPHDSSTGGKEMNRKRRADYNRYVANHAVFPMLDRVLLSLGVNTWISDWDPVQRPAPRQVSVQPGDVPPK